LRDTTPTATTTTTTTTSVGGPMDRSGTSNTYVRRCVHVLIARELTIIVATTRNSVYTVHTVTYTPVEAYMYYGVHWDGHVHRCSQWGRHVPPCLQWGGTCPPSVNRGGPVHPIVDRRGHPQWVDMCTPMALSTTGWTCPTLSIIGAHVHPLWIGEDKSTPL